MKKQLLKGATMLASIVVLALATAIVGGAQTRSRQIKADIPFDFVVGERTLTAGNYAVGTISTSSAEVIAVRSKDGRQRAIRLTNAVKDNATTRRARLVFHRYGDTYFLAQVWASGSSEGREMLKSKAERAAGELAKNASGGEVARGNGPEVVTIMASLD